MRLVILTNNGLNVHLTNILDADIYIIYLLSVQNHLKITRNEESKYVSTKKVIVNRKKNQRTVMMIIIKIKMYQWPECLVMTKDLVDI